MLLTDHLPESLCSRPFGRQGLAAAIEELHRPPTPNRTELARRLCQRLNWHNAAGKPQLMSARVALLELHRRGLLELPPPLKTNSNGRRHPLPTPAGYERSPICASAGRLAPLCFERTEGRGGHPGCGMSSWSAIITSATRQRPVLSCAILFMAANIKHELAGIDLGDARRDLLIGKLAARMAASPMASIRAACSGWPKAIAGFRLLNSPSVTADKILDVHESATLERARSSRLLLLVQDTTELDYTSHKALKGAGRLDKQTRRGFYAHSRLLVDEDTGIPWVCVPRTSGPATSKPRTASTSKCPLMKRKATDGSRAT